MEITENTKPEEVKERIIKYIENTVPMRIQYEEGKPTDDSKNFEYFMNLVCKGRTDYYLVSDFEWLLNNRSFELCYDQYEEDDTERVAQECIDLLEETHDRFCAIGIPFDQIQLSTRMNLICKKDVIDRIVNEMGTISNPMTEEEREKLDTLFGMIKPSDIADKVYVQIGGNVDTTGLEDNSLRQMLITLEEAEKNGEWTNLMYILSSMAVNNAKMHFEFEIISGVIDLKKFTEIMESIGCDVSFGTTQASSENVKESYISEYCKEGNGFNFNITSDFGRKELIAKRKQKEMEAK